MTSYYTLADGFLIPWIIFALGSILAGKIIKVNISLGTSLVLGFVLTAMLPMLIFSGGIDLITILAIILFGFLVARYMTNASVLGTMTLFVLAILVGGYLLQLLTGSSLAFR